MKFSKRIEACTLSPVRKFYPYEVDAAARGVTVHHLNIGQPDIETPEVYFDAVRNFESAVVAYAPAPGTTEFLNAVKDYYAGLGCNIGCEHIAATYGGSEALQIVLSCILEDGDEVLIPEPYYPNYDTFIRVLGGKICPIHTCAEEGYHYADRARIEPLIHEKTRAIIMTNPGNPTGAVLNEEERRVMVDIAKKHDLFLISDEVYREIVYGGRKINTMLQYEDAAENIVVIDSVSKRFSATGARVGALVSRNMELMRQVDKMLQSRLCINAMAQAGAAAMYNCLKQEYYDDVLRQYEERRNALVSALSKLPGVRFNSPEGAFYLIVDLPVDSTEKLQYFLLEEFAYEGETVMITPAEGFYSNPEDGRSKARIAYVVHPEELTRSIEVLGRGMEAYREKYGMMD
jgi:aspartate aminotransferase